MGPNDVTDALKQYVGDDGPQVAAVAGGDDAPFVAIASTGAVDAEGVVNQITDQFGGGGGGSPTFAQGGGLDANPAAVVTSLRSTDSE
jgi:Alanyl-tRNA synthetase